MCWLSVTVLLCNDTMLSFLIGMVVYSAFKNVVKHSWMQQTINKYVWIQIVNCLVAYISFIAHMFWHNFEKANGLYANGV